MDKPSILHTPTEHFIRAAELKARWEFLTIRAKEVAIKDKFAATIIMQSAETDRAAAVCHVAKGLEALSLSMKLGITDTSPKSPS